MDREEWLRSEIERIKAGGDMVLICVMSGLERQGNGLCHGTIPPDRLKRHYDTCSKECAQDKKRLQRWQDSKGCCRMCSRPLPKQKRLGVLREAHEVAV